MSDTPAVMVRGLGVKYNLKLTRRRTLRETLAQSLRGAHTRQTTDFWALRDIDFDVHAGESVGVLGRNGCGKSTLMMAIAGVIGPDTGTVNTFGRRATLLTLGAGFEPELTGRQNIYLNGAYLGLSGKEIDRLLDPILDFSELGDFIDAPLRTYSNGMKARLGFSIAAHTDPEILLLDEVLSVGDMEFQMKSRRRLGELMGQARAILIVSHSLEFIEQTCSRVLWLEKGCVRGYGPFDEIAEAYAASGAEPEHAPVAPAPTGMTGVATP